MLSFVLILGAAVSAELEMCTCPKFQDGLQRGDTACQFGGANCADLANPGGTCPGKAVACKLSNAEVNCKCPSYQEGSKDGDVMCEFGGSDCRQRGDKRCPKAARTCFLSVPQAPARRDVTYKECTCKGFQNGLKQGDTACQFGGVNCANLYDKDAGTCPSKAEACTLGKSVACECGSHQDAPAGSLMCEFDNKSGKNCRLRGDSKCPKVARTCFLGPATEEARMVAEPAEGSQVLLYAGAAAGVVGAAAALYHVVSSATGVAKEPLVAV